jgi:hypothetical protein
MWRFLLSKPNAARKCIALKIELAVSIAFFALSIGIPFFVLTVVSALDAEAALSVCAIMFISLAFVLFYLFSTLQKYTNRLRVLTAAEARQIDERAPVLYLRSFSDEMAISDGEQALAMMLKKIGPLIAIGRPNEFLPQLGAFRIYVPDAEWQTKVLELIEEAQLVVIVGGKSQGLGWEISQCYRLLTSNRMMVLLPSHKKTVLAFSRFFASATNIELAPYFTNATRPFRWSRCVRRVLGIRHWWDTIEVAQINGLIAFDDQWKPRAYPVEYTKDELLADYDPTYGAQITPWPFRLASALKKALEATGGSASVIFPKQEAEAFKRKKNAISMERLAHSIYLCYGAVPVILILALLLWSGLLWNRHLWHFLAQTASLLAIVSSW